MTFSKIELEIILNFVQEKKREYELMEKMNPNEKIAINHAQKWINFFSKFENKIIKLQNGEDNDEKKRI